MVSGAGELVSEGWTQAMAMEEIGRMRLADNSLQIAFLLLLLHPEAPRPRTSVVRCLQQVVFSVLILQSAIDSVVSGWEAFDQENEMGCGISEVHMSWSTPSKCPGPAVACTVPDGSAELDLTCILMHS